MLPVAFVTLSSPPAAARRQTYVLPLFHIYFFYFNDFCQIYYLNLYQADLHQIFSARLLAVDERSARDVGMATNCVGPIQVQSTELGSRDIR